MASAKHFRKLSMPSGCSETPTSMPPAVLRLSAIATAPVLATDTMSTLAGRPNPKSRSRS
uniref:Uncharacterized protein n=1 Tax=Arundo donax TaxID=35708 RepID=A0A0A9B8T9_ARUDO